MSSFIGKILSFVRVSTVIEGETVNSSDIKVDTGGGANTTAGHFDGAGADAFPLDSDWAILSDLQPTGTQGEHGFVDPINPSRALKGERRIMGRQTSDGLEVCTVWCKNDGSILAENALGSWTLETNGNINLNGVIITPAGSVTLPSGQSLAADSIKANGKEMAGHDHNPGTFAAGGDAVTGVSGANN